MEVYQVLFILALFYSCNGYVLNYNGYISEKIAEKKAKLDSAKAAEADQIVYEHVGEEKEGVAKINQFTVLRLVGGADSCEGRLELLTSDGLFRQTCDLNTGDPEARAYCSDLGCNSEGAQRVDPVQFGFSTAINLYVSLAFDCTGSESTILECQNANAVCVTDSPAHAIALDCGGTSGQELRLVGGSNTCEGRLVTLRNGLYGQACNLNTDNNEARVVCRQLGCNPVGAQRVDPVQFGFTNVIGRYHTFGEDCNGSESNINQCAIAGSVCAADSVPHAVAIQCGGAQTNIQNFFQE